MDVLVCPKCPGRMELIAVVTKTEAVRRVLTHLGLPAEAPAIHAARPPPQAALPFERDHREAVDPPAPDDWT